MKLIISVAAIAGLTTAVHGRPRFLQDSGASNNFVCKYDTPPDVIPFTPDESPVPTRAPFPTAAFQLPPVDCIPDIEIDGELTMVGDDFDYPPINILKYEEDKVTFTASQTWADKTLCQVAVDYSSADQGGDMVCDPHAGVAAGEIGSYTAMCIDGFATITLYAQDDFFKPNGNAKSVPSRCGTDLTPGSSTITHTIKIPCVMEPGCPANEPPVCDGSEDMIVAPLETFENDNVDGWLYANPGSEGGNGFLGPTSETVKAFWVPTEADALTITFTVLELSCDSKMVVRLDDSLIELGSAFDCVKQDVYKGYAGDVYIESTPVSNTENQVTMLVPPEWFQDTGRLVVGFVASTVGIDDFDITSVCSGPVEWPVVETEAPSSAPTADCVPNVLIDGAPGFPSDLDYDPIEILSFDNKEVVFSASQTWADQTLCQVAVDYSAASAQGNMVCDPHSAVGPGEFGTYRAVCVNGFATITVYAQDDFFKPIGNAKSVPSRCGSITPGSSTITHTIKIPCSLEPGCPANEPPVCDGSEDMVVVEEETFTDGVDGWLYANPGLKNGNGFLGPTEETAKTFAVPTVAEAVVVTFKVLELDCDAHFVLRVDDALVELGSAFDCTKLDSYAGYAGDMWVQSTAITATENEMQLIIPADWFKDSGRLTIGFVSSTVGIDDFTMESDCSGSVEWPAGDCVPDIEFVQGLSTDFEYPPIEILSYEGDKVVFSASQTWTEDTLCQVAVDYSAADKNGAMTCDSHAGVAPGEIDVYRAVCVKGFAHIDVYAHDEFFAETTLNVPSRCSVANGAHTHSYKIVIPCNPEPGCASKTDEAICAGAGTKRVAFDDFQNDEASSWMFGDTGRAAGGSFLAPTTAEVSKTFSVPKTASSVSVSFKTIKFATKNSVHLRIENHVIDLGDVTAAKGFFGDIEMTTTNGQVKLKVPKEWYADTGRLTLGFVDSNAGIDEFAIDATCGG
ncbi:hypothetical protein MPSEU_001072700 [Mayamaea pseudoterrestris]|nr:hypothetical protein MPSEU_001072700 [Mayamaea pseudoterrestris]